MAHLIAERQYIRPIAQAYLDSVLMQRTLLASFINTLITASVSTITSFPGCQLNLRSENFMT